MCAELVSSLSDFVKTRFKPPYKIIEQKKHVYNDIDENRMVFKLLCNSLARVSTPLFIQTKEILFIQTNCFHDELVLV